MISIVIYVSDKRPNLVDSVTNKNFLELEIIKMNSLTNFVSSYGKNLSHTTHLVIDLSCLADNEDEMVTALNTLKRIYIDMTIILFADDSKFHVDNKSLLRRIFEKGIYNILLTANDEDISHCLMFGMTADEARKIFEQEQAPDEAQSHQEAKKPDIFGFVEQNSMTNIEERILPNKEFRKYKKHVSIAVCGVGPNVGTTHSALQITKFLNDVGFKTAYLEAQENKSIVYLKSFYPQNSMFNEKKNLLQCFGIPIYSGFNISEVMAQNYDFYVFDLGVLDERILTSFLTKDINVLVSGSKPWELKELAEKIKIINMKNTVNLFLNFVYEKDKNNLLTFMERLRETTFFAEYQPNPFEGNVNLNIYKEVFREYLIIEEKQSPPEQKKKSVFSSAFKLKK